MAAQTGRVRGRRGISLRMRPDHPNVLKDKSHLFRKHWKECVCRRTALGRPSAERKVV